MSKERDLQQERHTLRVNNVGPIKKLSGYLSKFCQNLIFAKNGVGKSYLARSFQLLDNVSRNEEITYPMEIMTFDGATKGDVELRKESQLGFIEFENEVSEPRIFDPSCIFHVFSTEFVKDKILVNDYNIEQLADSEIQLDTIVNEYKNSELELLDIRLNLSEIENQLSDRFNEYKKEFIDNNPNINKVIKEYKLIELTKVYEMPKSSVVVNELQLMRKLQQLNSVSNLHQMILNIKFTNPQLSRVTPFLREFGVIHDDSSEIGQTKILKRINKIRVELQREICISFNSAFVSQNKKLLSDRLNYLQSINKWEKKLNLLEISQPDESRKKKFGATLSKLLDYFFPGKYSFDTNRFVIKRGQTVIFHPTYTLSDGEKSVINFCIYIASIHFKVDDLGNYEQLYLIIDDPVNSMSYDLIHAVCDVLKRLRISSKGDVTLKQDKRFKRPKMLILTHNTYFANLCRENYVVAKKAVFKLQINKENHEIVKIGSHIPPFSEDLREIKAVKDGNKNYSRSTGNAIRCVLEYLWRFCRPDLSSLEVFIDETSIKDKNLINLLLIHSNSHGIIEYEDIDVNQGKRICAATINVVEEFACGQITMIDRSEKSKVTNFTK